MRFNRKRADKKDQSKIYIYMLWKRDWNKLGTLARGEAGVRNVVVIWERRERGRLSGWAYRGKKNGSKQLVMACPGAG